MVRKIRIKIPEVPEVEIKIPTPFGVVRLPIEPPIPRPPQIDDRRRAALLHALAKDLSMIFGLIPYVGDYIADTIEDLHAAELRRIMTSEEKDYYYRYDKLHPSTIAALLTFGRVRVRK